MLSKPVIRHSRWFDTGDIIVEVPGGKFYKYKLTSKYFYDQALLRRRGWYNALKKNSDSEHKVVKK